MAIKHRQLAYAHIRQKVLLGKLPMGSRLSEEALAGEIGVSRTPVREALNQLGAEGLLNLVPNHGAFVKQLSRRDVKELYELRAMLEGYAAKEAAARITPEQLDQIQILCDRMRRMCHQLRDNGWRDFPDDLREQWILTDVAFHLLILHVAASPRTAKIVSDLRIMTQLCGRRWIDSGIHQNIWYYTTWSSHLRIVRALRKRDGSAARSMIKHHVRVAMKGVLDYFHPSDPLQIGHDLPEPVRQTIGEMEQLITSRQKGATP